MFCFDRTSNPTLPRSDPLATSAILNLFRHLLPPELILLILSKTPYSALFCPFHPPAPPFSQSIACPETPPPGKRVKIRHQTKYLLRKSWADCLRAGGLWAIAVRVPVLSEVGKEDGLEIGLQVNCKIVDSRNRIITSVDNVSWMPVELEEGETENVVWFRKEDGGVGRELIRLLEGRGTKCVWIAVVGRRAKTSKRSIVIGEVVWAGYEI